MRATRNQSETNGRKNRHTVRILQDPARQRVRAECDRHGWQSEWCALGPGHPYDPAEGWTPPAELVHRAAARGETHLRSSSSARRV